jgi:hypothetical protein
MIKKFDSFDKKELDQKERESFERELSARKKEKQEDLFGEITFGELETSIKEEVDNAEKYHISLGKKEIENTGVFNQIQYDSDNIGRVFILEPEDNSTVGYFECNGKSYLDDGDNIRNFYHYLKQLIKNDPIMENNEFDEYKNTICSVHSEDWEALYFNGRKLSEGHSINVHELLGEMIENNICMGDYRFISFPTDLEEEHLEEVNYEFPFKLKDAFDLIK